MSVHGVGAATAHRPQFVQQTSTGTSHPAPQSSIDGSPSIVPATGTQPPAHGVRRLIEAGHFDGKNSYGPLTAKFGAPVGPTEQTTETAGAGEAETPAEDATESSEETQTGIAIDASGTALDGAAPTVQPADGGSGLDQLLPEAKDPLDAPSDPSSDPGLLDMNTLLMQELINQQDPATDHEQPATDRAVDQTSEPSEATNQV